MKITDKIQLKNAIRLLIGGALWGDEIKVDEVPDLLMEMSKDYKKAIKKYEAK